MQPFQEIPPNVYFLLFEKLSTLLNNLEKSKEMGNKCREFVKNNFNWDKICNDFLNHLKKHNIGDI